MVAAAGGKVAGSAETAARALEAALPALRRPVRLPPSDSTRLDRDPAALFATGSDLWARLLTVAEPAVAAALYPAWAAATAVAPQPAHPVQVQRVRAVPYGATAPRKPVLNENGVPVDTEEWPLESAATARAVVALQNRTPTSVRVEMSRGGQRQTATVQTVPGDQLVTFPGLGTVRVDAPADANHVSTGVVTITYAGAVSRVITVGEPPPVINVAAPPGPPAQPATMGSGPVPVVVDHLDLIWRPEAGETLHRTAGDRSVTVGLGRRPRAITVVDETAAAPASRNVLLLNAVYEQIVPRTWVVVERPGAAPLVKLIDRVDVVSKSAYNLPATVTQLTLRDEWLTVDDTLLSSSATPPCTPGASAPTWAGAMDR